MVSFSDKNKPKPGSDNQFNVGRHKSVFEKRMQQDIADSEIPRDGIPGQILTRTLNLWEWADSVGGGVDYTGATTGQVFSFDGTTGYWRDESVTIDATGGSAGDVVRFDGTGYYVDPETVELPAAGTAGNLLESNGTVFVSAAPKLPAPGTAGNVPVSNGSAWVATAPDAGVVTATGQAAGEVPQFDGSNGYTTFKVTISTSAPSGGSDGDLWFKY